MQVLTIDEVNEVSGGVVPVAVYAAGIATGLAANYIYESIGGKAGIDKAINAFSNFLAESSFEMKYM